MRGSIVIWMPQLGHTTGEMPHLRNPPKNYMPGQQLFYLSTACRSLGYDVRVVDANWSTDPVARALEVKPDKILLSTATPTFTGTQKAIADLRSAGYDGEVFVGGPHVSLNHGMRDFLLPRMTGVTYIPVVKSFSTFEWVSTVFPGRSPFEVLDGRSEAEASTFLADAVERDRGTRPKGPLDRYIFSYFKPSVDWLPETYTGDHVRPEMRSVPIRHSIITSIGCSKTCSFCGNPYIYRIGFKDEAVVREMLTDYRRIGVDRVSVHDMYFVMYEPHARDMMRVLKEKQFAYSMQTCLEDLNEELLSDLRDSGLKKFLVGIENPVSYSVGKKVDLPAVSWLLDKSTRLGLGVKLSYIVGLPGVKLVDDLALLHHIETEVTSRAHPIEDLQVNLYTPYRPEPNTLYLPYGVEEAAEASTPRSMRLPLMMREAKPTIRILTSIPFTFWGSFPVGMSREEDFKNQMILCDVVYNNVYSAFVEPYRALRELYVAEVRERYPSLMRWMPSFDESISKYERLKQEKDLTVVLEQALADNHVQLAGLR